MWHGLIRTEFTVPALEKRFYIFIFLWSLLMHEHSILSFYFYFSAGQERQFAHTHFVILAEESWCLM